MAWQNCMPACVPSRFSHVRPSVHEILQARTLERVGLPFSRDYKAIITVEEKMDSSLTQEVGEKQVPRLTAPFPRFLIWSKWCCWLRYASEREANLATGSEVQRLGTSLVVQWLRLHTPNAEGPGLNPRQGTRSHMLQIRVHTSS